MASEQLKHQIFSADSINITVNDILIDSFFMDGDDLILRAVETLDWETERQIYYEWTISHSQWNEAAVDKNKITVHYNGNAALEIEIWAAMPVDLQEFSV